MFLICVDIIASNIPSYIIGVCQSSKSGCKGPNPTQFARIVISSETLRFVI
jgi:hypothetical protein